MPRVLAVDDDPDILESLTIALGDEHDVETAADGREALERLLAADRPGIDVVVLDLMMPRMSGADLVQALRERGVRVPIILTSAVHDLPERAALLGVDGFLEKPYRLKRLRASIASVAGAGARAPTSRLVRVQRCSLASARGTGAACRTRTTSSERPRVRRTRS